MIGKIMCISDTTGQTYVDAARPAWRNHGYVLEDWKAEDAIHENSFFQYYMIALTMSSDNFDQYKKYLTEIRSKTNTPIVLFPYDPFAYSQIMDSVHDGADQVIALPAEMEWVILNCLALIRRYTPLHRSNEAPFTICSDYRIYLDEGRYAANVNGKLIELHKKEFQILRYLMEHRGLIRSYGQILQEVWGYDYSEESKTLLFSQIKNLRRKIQWDPSLPQYIKTKHGVGYSFAPHLDF